MNKINLLCFHYAGGNKYSFESYLKVAPKHVNIISNELPGRGLRSNEQLLISTKDMVNDLFEQILKYLDQPYAFYGHSMGGLLAYLLTKRILQNNGVQPLYLFLSGCGGPSVLRTEPLRYLLPRNKFINKLNEMGGSPDIVLNDVRLMNYFLPILRADFQATETFVYEPTEPFNIPMYVLIGKDDSIDLEHARAWKQETTREVEINEFPGKHFFIYNFQEEIMEIIGLKLDTFVLNGSLE